jgi:hypothetical protein
MLNGHKRPQATPKQITSPVTVTTSDIARFREINMRCQANFKDIASCIKQKKPELADFEAAEVIVINKKDDHFKSVKRIVGGSTLVVETILGFSEIKKDHYAYKIFKTVTSHKEWFALKVCDYVEADLLIYDDVEEVINKVVAVPSEGFKPTKISTIIKDLGAVDSIADGFESIVEKGPTSDIIFPLIIDIVSSMWVTRSSSVFNTESFLF